MLSSSAKESPQSVASSAPTPTATTDLDNNGKDIPEDEVTPPKQTTPYVESQPATMGNTASALKAHVQELESEFATLSGLEKGLSPFHLAAVEYRVRLLKSRVQEHESEVATSSGSVKERASVQLAALAGH